jgi:hypothetical protein
MSATKADGRPLERGRGQTAGDTTNGVISDQTEGHGPGIHTGAMHGEKPQAHQTRAELFELVNS